MKNSNFHINDESVKGMHGYGISIVEDIIKENEGSYEWHDEEDVFEASLMLKYKGADINVDRDRGR